MAFTDLLCPHGLLKENSQSLWLSTTADDDQPLGMQLYGQDPDLMAKAARWAVDHGAATIDINMGCPVDKVTKTFAGSMMLCTPDATVGVAERLVNTVDVPVTAKLRLGYLKDELTAPALADRLVGVGIKAITIHGRTAFQRFKGSVSWDGITEVVNAIGGRVPVFGNGDIHTPMDAQRMIAYTGCDGVMIARTALQAPWILRDTHHLLSTGEMPRELTLRERVEVIQRHFHNILRFRESKYALIIMRQKIGGYGKFLGHCRPLKDAIRALTDASKFDHLVESYLEQIGEAADRIPVTWADRQEVHITNPPVATRSTNNNATEPMSESVAVA